MNLICNLPIPHSRYATLRQGTPQLAHQLISAATIVAAQSDGETAYRLATFYAADNDPPNALRWLRKAIYLGNENFPWFAHNPAWQRLRTNEDFHSVLAELKARYNRIVNLWQHLLVA